MKYREIWYRHYTTEVVKLIIVKKNKINIEIKKMIYIIMNDI